MRILPRLDYSRFVSRPKILAGFSDLTALHLYIAGVLDVATLHAPVIKSVGLHQPGGSTLASLREALFGERVAPFDVTGLESVQPGRATGRVLGGNLTILTHLLDSHFCPDLNGTLLLIEEVGEEDYRLDRMMTALRLSAKAGSPAGILLGDFTDCGGAYLEDDEIDAFVQTLASEFDCPIVADFPSGHGDRNIAVPIGVRATLDATEGRLTFDEDVCSL
jgi:muramoyltetrapeptide carboxypeptidase